MKRFVIQSLRLNLRIIAMLMLFGVSLSHATDVPLGAQILKSTNSFGEGFLYPFVEDEQYYELIKNDSVYYPFDWGTTFETLDNNSFLFEIAKNSGFLEVARRTPLRNSSPDGDPLWCEQQEFLKDMNFEKLENFWPEMKIGKDNEGKKYSHSHYKSYVFHSKEFKASKQIFPCLIGSNQLSDSFVLGKFDEQQILYDYQRRILKSYNYQFYFYHLYDKSRENHYILWIEAYNPKKTATCVLDQITIRRIQNLYYLAILDIIENLDIEEIQPSVIDLTKKSSDKQAEIVSEMPNELSIEVKETPIEISKFSESLLIPEKTTEKDSPSDVIIQTNNDNGENCTLTPVLGEGSSKPETRKRRSLSGYVTKSRQRVSSLNLHNMTNSMSTPNSPTTLSHEYKTGLTPKSAPSSDRRRSDNRVRISDGGPSIIELTLESGKGKGEGADATEDHQEIIEKLRVLENQSEKLAEERRKLIQKLTSSDKSVGTTISSPRITSLRSSSPSDQMPRTSSPRSSTSRTSTPRDQSPLSERRRDFIRSSTTPTDSPANDLRTKPLREKRTRSVEQQYIRRSDRNDGLRKSDGSREKIIVSRDKSVSPRDKSNGVTPRDKSVSPRDKTNGITSRDKSVSPRKEDKSEVF